MFQLEMLTGLFILTALSVPTIASRRVSDSCYKVDTINRSIRDDYCDQPLFINFRPRDTGIELVDNMCMTYFPLPDDPDTFMVYLAYVYCDGSYDITVEIGTQMETGVVRKANPFSTFTEYTFGYAGCDTYLVYLCFNYGVDTSQLKNVFLFGVSRECHPLGLSCLRKVEEILRDHGFPEQDYYVMPQKLPNRCVTQQLCMQPPNPFYNRLPGHVGSYRI